MKRAYLAGAVATVGLAVAGFGLVQAPKAQAEATAAASLVPARADDFQLTDHTRLAHRLYYFGYTPAIVIMTQTNAGKVSHDGALKLEQWSKAYADKGALFYMLNSTDSRDAAAAWAAKNKITTPILMDEQQLVGEQLGVQREGEVYVINPKTWAIVYHGPISGAQAALDAVLAGKPVETARVAVNAGQAIAFPGRAQKAEFAKISYVKDVAPIVQEKCASCHLKGGIGPFAIDSYEVVKGFAPMIRETVRTRRMPPYFADPHIGHFQNDQGLTAEQTKTLVHWIEAGAPRGEGADPLLVNKTRVAEAWPSNLGKPDVIVDLPAYKVPASGIVEYQNQRVDNPFKEDVWLKAIAIKPGDMRVLHHVVSNHVPDPKAPRGGIPGGSVGSYTPGALPQVMAEGAGAPVPGGGKLNFQMHYTTFGKETEDRTQVGFYTLKTPPKYVKRSAVIGDFALYIPAGEARHKEVAYMTFPADAYLYTLYPHAHYRGYHVELKMRDAAGKETMLLSLPKYDFNWQRDYDPVEPILVKAGSKLIATWVYDNSAHNPANPDPKRNVTWGEQTPDEMMYFRVNYRWADETVGKLRNDLQAKLFESQMIGALDDNVDGKVQLAELRGPMGNMLKPKFAEMDKNKDGGLDANELMNTGGRQAMRRAMSETPDL